jgi:signal transduction histidine kinase
VIARAKSSLILVGLLLILLPLLAVLQYRWIGEVSAAERDRLESSLRVASDRFAADFEGEFSRLGNTFQIRDGFPETAAPIVERYQVWSEANPYARLVREIYLLKVTPENGAEFFRVDLAAKELLSTPLPTELEFIRDRFRRGPFSYSAGEMMMLVTPIFRAGRGFGGPGTEDFRQPRSENFRRRGERAGRRFTPDRVPPPDRGAPPDRGQRPDRPPGPGGGPGPGQGPGPGGPVDGTAIIELDRDVVLKDLIPALARKHFASHDETAYRIAILAGGDEPRVLYSSAGAWSSEDIANPDKAVNLFGSPRPAGIEGRDRGPGPRWPFQGSFVSEPWQLIVKHRAGSLEKAVEQVRTRNLAIAFGILLVLSTGLITVVISSQRAHTLGKLQMEFAAGVSHELRTPLAVIRSAAHNLRSGIVHDKEGVEEYAAIVQEEARRLSEMVEEVLLYSETQSGRKKYKLEPIDVHEVIDRAITNLSPAIDVDGCELTTHIDPDLPPAKADAAALAQCVQNLLSNAFKYGKNGDKTHIEIVVRKDQRANEIQLSVVDHGSGIESADQRQLFEAFYRGRNVGPSVPGNGLGLHLVKRIMQAQDGRVTYSPAPHGGAWFTLHIPAAS